MQEKRALVLGGAGFIGTHLFEALARSGEYAELVSLDIKAPDRPVPGVLYKHGDVRAPLGDDTCPKATEIYNLAALHVTPSHEDWEYFWTNTLGATHACAYARRIGCTEIVFVSSIAVYGPSESERTEHSSPAPETAYGRSKYCAEKIHRQWLEEKPEARKLVVCRPAAIYGRGENGNFTRLARALAQRRFAYPGRSDTIKSCGYVEDLVYSFRFALARPEAAFTYNFAHPQRYTSADIVHALCMASGIRRTVPTVPMPVMNLVGWGFEMLNALGLRNSVNRARIAKLNRSTNIVPQQLEALGFDFRFDLEQALHRWRETSSDGEYN